MKFLKILLYVVGAIIALVLIVPLFMASQFQVERSVIIQASDSLVYSITSDLSNRKAWDPWLEKEPGAVVTLSGPTSGVGAKYGWKGEELGTGEMTVLEVEQNRSIKCKIEWIEPEQGESMVLWTFEPGEEGTTVKWAISGDLGYPMERFFGPMMDGFLGPDFEKGLSNLKNLVEEKSKLAVPPEPPAEM